MRATLAFAVLLVCSLAGCKNPAAAEDVNARIIAAMHTLADHLEAGRTAEAKTSLQTLRELTATAKTLRLSPAQDAELRQRFALPLDAATNRLRQAVATSKLNTAELHELAR